MDSAVVAAELERTPGLVDGLESGWYLANGAAGRYQFAVDLESYLAAPGVADSPMAGEMRAAVDLPVGELRALPEVTGLIDRVREFLRLRREQVTGRQQFELALTGYEMWVPPVAGATGSVTLAAGAGGSGGLSFRILGVGGGPTFEQTVMLELSRTGVARSERLELVLTGTAEQVEVTRAGRVEARYLRLADLTGVPLHRFVPLVSPPRSAAAAETIFRVTLAPGDGAATFALRLAAARSWSMSATPRLDALGAEIGVGYVHKAGQALSFDFHLPDGYEYTAVEQLDRPAITWVTLPVPAG